MTRRDSPDTNAGGSSARPLPNVTAQLPACDHRVKCDGGRETVRSSRLHFFNKLRAAADHDCPHVNPTVPPPPGTPRRSRDPGRPARRRRARRLPRLGPGSVALGRARPAASPREGPAHVANPLGRPAHEGGRHRCLRRPLRRRSGRPRGLRREPRRRKDLRPPADLGPRRFERPVREYKAYAHGWIERTIARREGAAARRSPAASRADARRAWEKAWGDYMHLGADYGALRRARRRTRRHRRRPPGGALGPGLRRLPPARMGALDRPPARAR